MRQRAGWSAFLVAFAIAGCAESRSSDNASVSLRECGGAECTPRVEAGNDAGELLPEPDVAAEPDAALEAPVIEPPASPPSFASYQLALESCGALRESAYVAEDHAQLQSALLRDWFMCERGAWWNGDEIGIRIESNGRWTLLLLEGDSIALARDVSQKGDYIWGDTGTGSGGAAAILMDLAANPGDTSWEVYAPTFSDDPLRMYTWPVGRGDHDIELIAAP